MELPSSVYLVVGIMVIGNLTVLGTIIAFIFKSGIFVAETKAGIKDSKETAVRAHKRIDKVLENNNLIGGE